MENLSTIAIPSEPVWWWAGGLIIIALLVLTLPFRVKWCEHNLELFFLIMGILAVSVSRQWSIELVISTLKSPVIIGSLPIGIFQVVLIFGLLIHFFYKQFNSTILAMEKKLSTRVFIFILVLAAGLFSSIISVIVTSVLLAEIAAALPISRKDRIRLIVVACFATGLGAVLTPLGEPMSTILVQRLAGQPYNAGFFFPVKHFAIYIVPGVIAFALFGAIWIGRKAPGDKTVTSVGDDIAGQCEYSETVKTIIMRAVKVFTFVAALVLLGEGFRPLVVWFFTRVPAVALFWINIISAVLDNATLTAIEINSSMSISQIISIVMSLLIAGGMLIPGNIPNIVSCNRLKISMREWALIGIPIGLIAMVVYFIVLLPIIF
jgi:predicted cation transporter